MDGILLGGGPRRSPNAAVRPGRSALAFVLAATAGCFAPQEIIESVDAIVPNAPPMIDLRLVSPATPVVCISGLDVEATSQLTFGTTLRDANAIRERQELRARWFLDWPSSSAQLIKPEEELRPARDSDVYVVTPLTFAELANRLDPGKEEIHALELVVSDGFDGSSAAEPRNRAPREDKCRNENDPDPCYVTAYKWTLHWKPNTPCSN